MRRYLALMLSFLMVILTCCSCGSVDPQTLRLNVGDKSISIGDSVDVVTEVLGEPQTMFDSYISVGIVWQYDDLEITQLDGEVISIAITGVNTYQICGIRYGDSKESVIEKLSKISNVHETEDSAAITVEFSDDGTISNAVDDVVEFNLGISEMTKDELHRYGTLFVLFDEDDKVVLVNAYNQICNASV